jgi:N-acetylmuramoyl-L-alanine amidase
MTFTIANDRLVIDGQPVTYTASPNTSGARMEPTLIVLHDTAGSTAAGAVSWLCNRSAKVSAHLVIARDGSITQLVPFDRVAWHAGPSSFNGRSGCNGFSIGIEIDNPGGLRGSPDKAVASFGKVYAGAVAASDKAHWSKLWLPYTDAQIEAVEGIIAALAVAYPSIVALAGHHDISPGRKEDPTPLMPWDRMRAALGSRPKPIDPAIVSQAQEALAALGYNPGLVDGAIGQRTRTALFAFQQQNGLPATGNLDERTFGALQDAEKAKEMPLGGRPDLEAVPKSKTSMAASIIRGGTLGMVGIQGGSAAVDALTSAADVSEAVSAVEKGVGFADRVAGLVPKLEKLITWLQTPPGLKAMALVLVALIVWQLAGKIQAWRLADARSGANPTK